MTLFHSIYDRWLLKQRQKYYKIIGPTTVHFQHELYLLVSLSLLLFACLQIIYRNDQDFSLITLNTGDFVYVFWSTLWLSRHVVFRWITTWDNTSNCNPTIKGMLTHWITSHIMAGQYFDRPPQTQILKQMGIISRNTNAQYNDHLLFNYNANYFGYTDTNRIISGGAGSASVFGYTLSALLLPSIVYTLQWLRVRFVYPFTKVMEYYQCRGQQRQRAKFIRQQKRFVLDQLKTATSNKNVAAIMRPPVTTSYYQQLHQQQLLRQRKNSRKSDGASLSSFSSSSASYSGARISSSSTSFLSSSSASSSSVATFINQVVQLCNKLWGSYGPPLQMVIPVVTLIYYTWTLPLGEYFFYSPTVPPTTSSQVSTNVPPNHPHAQMIHHHQDVLTDFDIKPFGAYRLLEKPFWTQLLFLLSSVGTMSCLLLFSRIVLPIPDLVAGTNVLKAVRNEAKSYHASSTGTGSAFGVSGSGGGGGSRSSKGGHHHHHHHGRMSNRDGQNQETTPWAEQNKSIVLQGRSRLFVTVALVRIIENVFITMVLPRTSYACRAMGNCPEGVTMDNLFKIINPIGVSTPLRKDYKYYSAMGGGLSGGGYGSSNDIASSSAFTSQWILRAAMDRNSSMPRHHPILIPSFILSLLNPDSLTIGMIFLSVVLNSILILTVQATTLDRSYLAMMGHIAGEWTLVTKTNTKSSKSSRRTDSSNKSDSIINSGGDTPGQWDPRRRYKKGDLIVQNHYTASTILPSFITQSTLFTSLFHSALPPNSSSNASSTTTSYYKATSNSPEGRPFDLYLRATHDIFRNELGHVSTSKVITVCIRTHVIFMFLIILLMGWNYFWGYEVNNRALITTLLANIVTCYGVTNTGLTNRREIITLKDEISRL